MSHQVARFVPGIAVITTVIALTLALLPGISSAGQDDTLCEPVPDRVSIPDSFVVDACFDGTHLVLRNRQEIVMRAVATGSAGRPVRTAVGGTPTVASAAVERLHSTESGLMPPGYELRIPIGQANAHVELFGVKDYQTEYVLIRTFFTQYLSHAEVLGLADDIATLNQALQSATSDRRSCDGNSGGKYFAQLACNVGHASDASVALGRFASGQVDKIGRIKLSALLAFLDTAEWINAAVGDFGDFVRGTRALDIAAGDDSAEPPGGGTETPPVGTSGPTLLPATGPPGLWFEVRVPESCPAEPQRGRQEIVAELKDRNGTTHSRASVGTDQSGKQQLEILLAGRVNQTFEPDAPGLQESPPGEYAVKVECILYGSPTRITKTYPDSKFEMVRAFTVSASATRITSISDLRVTSNQPCPASATEATAQLTLLDRVPQRIVTRYSDRVRPTSGANWSVAFSDQDFEPGEYALSGSCELAGGQRFDYGQSGVVVIEDSNQGAVLNRQLPRTPSPNATAQDGSTPSRPTASRQSAPQSSETENVKEGRTIRDEGS